MSTEKYHIDISFDLDTREIIDLYGTLPGDMRGHRRLFISGADEVEFYAGNGEIFRLVKVNDVARIISDKPVRHLRYETPREYIEK